MDSIRARVRALWMRLLSLAGMRRPHASFEDELESHIALDTERGVRAGLSAGEARRQALVRLGGAERVRQAYRERSTLPWLEALAQDVRFALRMMTRNFGFTCVVVLELAVGIGATTTAFSWIDAVLLEPLSGVTEPGRLATLETVTANGAWVPNSYPDFIDFRDRLKLFDGIAVTHMAALSVGEEGHAERIWAELVSGNFFRVLGVKAEVGRTFLPSEEGDVPGAYPVVVISDRYWRSHYGADPTIVGRTIRINQHELTVVGVAAPRFHGSMPATAFDLWVPYMEQPFLNGVAEWMLRDRHNRNMLGIARIRPGVSVSQAAMELKTLADRMAIANADVSQGMSATLLPLWKSPHGPQGMMVGPLRMLMGVSVLVLLIVCANVANLLLARATAREKEFSARLALGAGRGRIARQMLTESLLVTGCGTALGLAALPLLTHSLRLLMPPSAVTSLVAISVRPDGAVLGFTAGICILVALGAGLIPALQASRINLNARLNSGGRSGTPGRRQNRLRSALVACEMALALVTLVGAGLFARSFAATLALDPGFDPHHVLLAQFYLSTNGYNLAARKEFCRRLEEHVLAAPGVTGVAYSDGVPLGFEPSWWEELQIEGYAVGPHENMNVFRNVISPGYLPLLHIPLVEGRDFTDQDNENTANVMIVNQAFVERFFAGRSPIGKKVHGWGAWFRVVGVARNSKYHYLGEPTPAYFYVPFRQVYRADMNLAFYVRTADDPGNALPALRAATRALDPNVTVFDATRLEEFIGASLYPQKVAAGLMGVLGGLAVALAALGLFSVMAYAVAQRTQEIGVRMALGARPIHVLCMVVGQGLAPTLAGLALGTVLAFGFARAAGSLEFTNSGMGANAPLLSPHAGSPLVIAASVVFLFAVALLAAYLPARRAARVDPMEALRVE